MLSMEESHRRFRRTHSLYASIAWVQNEPGFLLNYSPRMVQLQTQTWHNHQEVLTPNSSKSARAFRALPNLQIHHPSCLSSSNNSRPHCTVIHKPQWIGFRLPLHISTSLPGETHGTILPRQNAQPMRMLAKGKKHKPLATPHHQTLEKSFTGQFHLALTFNL